MDRKRRRKAQSFRFELPSPRQADNFFFSLSSLLVETGAWGGLKAGTRDYADGVNPPAVITHRSY
jgi:hypothetical protein